MIVKYTFSFPGRKPHILEMRKNWGTHTHTDSPHWRETSQYQNLCVKKKSIKNYSPFLWESLLTKENSLSCINLITADKFIGSFLS